MIKASIDRPMGSTTVNGKAGYLMSSGAKRTQPNLSQRQITAIKDSPKGQLPAFMMKTVGNKTMGATIIKSKTGGEVQAGLNTKRGGVHIGAGYDRANKSAGMDISVSGRRKTAGINIYRQGK